MGILQPLLLAQLIQCGHFVQALESVLGSHKSLTAKELLCLLCIPDGWSTLACRLSRLACSRCVTDLTGFESD